MGTRISYDDEGQPLEGYLATPNSARSLPGVLVVPSWLNVNESIRGRADRLAELGYSVFVVDLFGAGVTSAPPQKPMEVIGPLLQDRKLFRRRLLAGLAAFRGRPECDPDRIAAIGYCVGGCGVLELARAATPLRGVVSLHGILTALLPAKRNEVHAKILVLHGDDDPVAPFDHLAGFRDEMHTAQANWEVDIYGGARHGFTGEGLWDKSRPGSGFDSHHEARSWRATVEFLEEVLL
jgi:dienelactone hydrolase